MSTEKTLQIDCGSLEDTLQLGELVGKACRGGEVFELISDLGGGKTAFVRGLANGLGTADEVSSPSFTINNSYQGSSLILEHYDFYRLDQAGVVAEELKESISRNDTVTAVEWGDIIHDVLPESTIRINISVTESEARQIKFSYEETCSYLFKGLSL